MCLIDNIIYRTISFFWHEIVKAADAWIVTYAGRLAGCIKKIVVSNLYTASCIYLMPPFSSE